MKLSTSCIPLLAWWCACALAQEAPCERVFRHLELTASSEKPDCEIAVSADHIVAITNIEIAFFTKCGSTWHSRSVPDGFWSEVGAAGANWFIFDPEVHWDSHAGRFWAMANARGPESKSYICLAVSDDSNPGGPPNPVPPTPLEEGVWHKYLIDVTSVFGAHIDSPNMAVDEEAVYLSALELGGAFFPVLVLPKAPLLVGDPAPAWSQIPVGLWAYAPAVNHSFDALPQYILEDRPAISALDIHALLDPLGSPSTETLSPPLDVEAFAPPVPVPQPDGPDLWTVGTGTRFLSCIYRDGSIWATHHITRPSDNPKRTIARWYQIDMMGWPASGIRPEVRQWGEIDPGGDLHAFYPSIAADGSGGAAITFNRGGASEVTGMWRALRCPQDALNTFPSIIQVKPGTGSAPWVDWGDYSDTSPDPAAPAGWSVFWGYHEIAVVDTGGGAAETWIARYAFQCGPDGLDFNGDGKVDEADLVEFQALFTAGDEGADLNGDWTVDSLDMAQFLKGYSSK